MPTIKYISISDLHLGADNSLLTNIKPKTSQVDPSQPSAVLVQLVACLRSLLREQATKPTLVLNGDLLELALALDNVAITAFERFIELLFPPGNPVVNEKMIFIPGNHDHHLWESARETQYVHFLQSVPVDKELEPPWHTTKMFDADPVDAFLLNAVIQRLPDRKNISIGTVYPNLAYSNSDRCVIFTHGHFVESIYTLMSSLRRFLQPKSPMPTEVWDLEEENFAWIDFFWSTMGRSGQVGADVERIYNMLLVPEMRKKLADQVGHAIAEAKMPNLPGAGHLFAWIVSSMLAHAGGLEKTKNDEPLSPEALMGLKGYLEGPVRKQFESDSREMAKHVSVIFGHTHKPFASCQDFNGFPRQTGVFNSGGWVVDTPEVAPTHGGAVIFVDDEYNVASLRIYNERDTKEKYAVKVEVLEDGTQNRLRELLQQSLDSSSQDWARLSSLIAEAVDTYHANFRMRLKAIEQES